ncbi:MAG: hypothetical protein WBZ19_27830 [Chthoniobacterales bacterium]
MEITYLQNKRARIFIDNDKAGQEAAERWAIQLRQANIVVDGFSFAGLLRTNGQPVKDRIILRRIAKAGEYAAAKMAYYDATRQAMPALLPVLKGQNSDASYGKESTEIFGGFGADKDEETTAILEAKLYRWIIRHYCPYPAIPEDGFSRTDEVCECCSHPAKF